MPSLMQLPAYEIKNALINFSPIGEAIDSNRAYGLRQRQADLQDKQFGLDEQRLSMQKRSADQDYEHKALQHIGGLAQRAAETQDLNERAKIHAAVLARHPGRANLPAQYLDPVNGPALIAAEARGYQDPNAEALKKAQIGLAQSGASENYAKADLYKQQIEASKNDPEKLIMQQLFGGQQPQQAVPQQPVPNALVRPQPQQMPQPQAPGLKPMSFDAPQGQQGDPNLIQVADGQPGQAQSQPDVVTVPGMGVMPRAHAEKMRLYAAMKKNTQLEGLLSTALDGRSLEKGARGELDKSRINYTQALGRIDEIEKQFDANFLKAGTQVGQWFDGKLEKLGVAPSPETQAQMQKFHQFRSTAIAHFNRVLKEMSGTAVSQQEFERIVAELPNPGTGMMNGAFDGDHASAFIAKMKNAKMQIKMAAARANYIADKGFRNIEEAAAAVPLGNMTKIIDDRGSMLEREMRATNPNAQPQAIQAAVDRRLKQEFGI